MLSARRPSEQRLRALATQGRVARVTYTEVAATIDGLRPAGYRHDAYEVTLGTREGVFEAVTRAMQAWEIHRRAGIHAVADGPLAVGTTVALAAPLPVGYALATCRVVHLIDETHRFGFAYGTLPRHPEQGEELFLVERTSTGTTFTIVAFSRPRHPAARLARPVARRLQLAATRRYLEAARSIAHSADPT